MRRIRAFVGALALIGACAQTDDAAPAGPWVLYDVSGAADLFNHPFPSSVRFADGEHTRLDDLPNPLGLDVVAEIAGMVADHATGGSLDGGLMLRFAADPDLSSWPTDPQATTAETAKVSLVELAVEGEPSGRRIPFRWQYFRDAGTYHRERTLRIVPDYGWALEPDASYALVIRRGAGVAASPQMRDLLANRAPSGALGARALRAVNEARGLLHALGIATDDLVLLHPFKTDDPARSLHDIVSGTIAAGAAGSLRHLVRTRDKADFCLVEGVVDLPQYQRGTPGYLHHGGEWVFDTAGRLIEQRREDVPVAVVFPKGTMPAGGWPLVVYIHGTAGTSVQVIDRGPTPPGPDDELGQDLGHLTAANKGPGWVLARRGIASAGSALPLNPQRVPSALGWGMYNFPNPRALRDNFRQGVLEQALFLRALLAERFDPSLCPGSDATASPDGKLYFDGRRVGAMGQSLGAIELGLWAPIEPLVGAVVPSGAGGNYALMITVSTIIPGELVLRALTMLNDRETPTLAHPLGLAVAQAFDSVDPAALAARMSRRPLASVGAKHVYTPAGYMDGFFMPDSIRSLYGPLGVAMAGAEVHPSLPQMMVRLGRPNLGYPASANLRTPDGLRTAVTVQWAEDGILDGHHVSFQLDGPKHQYGCFFRTYFDDGTPVVPVPQAITSPCE